VGTKWPGKRRGCDGIEIGFIHSRGYKWAARLLTTTFTLGTPSRHSLDPQKKTKDEMRRSRLKILPSRSRWALGFLLIFLTGLAFAELHGETPDDHDFITHEDRTLLFESRSVTFVQISASWVIFKF